MGRVYANISRKPGQRPVVTVFKNGNTYTYGGNIQQGSPAAEAIAINKQRKEERSREIEEYGKSGELSPQEYKTFHSTFHSNTTQVEKAQESTPLVTFNKVVVTPVASQPQPGNRPRDYNQQQEQSTTTTLTQQQMANIGYTPKNVQTGVELTTQRTTQTPITSKGLRETQAQKRNLPIFSGTLGLGSNKFSIALAAIASRKEIETKSKQLDSERNLIDNTSQGEVNAFNKKVTAVNKLITQEQYIQGMENKSTEKSIEKINAELEKREGRLIILRQEAQQFKGYKGRRLRQEIRAEQENIFSLEQKKREIYNQPLESRPDFSQTAEQKNLIVKQQGSELRGVRGRLGYAASVVGQAGSKAVEKIVSGEVSVSKIGLVLGVPFIKYTPNKTEKDIKQVQKLRQEQQKLLIQRQAIQDNTQTANSLDKKIKSYENKINKIDRRINIVTGIKKVSEQPRTAGLIASAGAGATAGVGLLSVSSAAAVGVASKVLPATGTSILKSSVAGIGLGLKTSAGLGYAGVTATELGSIKNKQQRQEKLGEKIGELAAFSSGAAATEITLLGANKFYQSGKTFNPKKDFLLKGKSQSIEKISGQETNFKGIIEQNKFKGKVDITYKTIKLKSGQFQDVGTIKINNKPTKFTRLSDINPSVTQDSGLKSIIKSSFKIDKTLGVSESEVYDNSIITQSQTTRKNVKDIYTKLLDQKTDKVTIVGQVTKGDVVSKTSVEITEASFQRPTIFNKFKSEITRVFKPFLRSKKASLSVGRDNSIYGQRFIQETIPEPITAQPKISSSFKTTFNEPKVSSFGTYSTLPTRNFGFSNLISGITKPKGLPLPNLIIIPPTLSRSKTIFEEKPNKAVKSFTELELQQNIIEDYGYILQSKKETKPIENIQPKTISKPISINFTTFSDKTITKVQPIPISFNVPSYETITKIKPVITTEATPRTIQDYIFTPTPSPTTQIFKPGIIIPGMVLFPSIGGGGGSGFSLFKRTKVKQQKRFTPTFRAAAFKLEGKTPKGYSISGLGARFIPKVIKKKKKKVIKYARRRRRTK